MINNRMLDAYFSGVKNLYALQNRQLSEKVLYLLKLFFLLLVLIIFSSNDKTKQTKLWFFSNIRMEKITASQLGQVKHAVYLGTCFKSFDDVRFKYSFVTPFNRFERIKIVIRGGCDYLFHVGLDYNIFLFIEFVFIKKCLEYHEIREVYDRGNYNLLTTWLGNLSSLMNYKFIVYQHGVVDKQIMVPCKFFCTFLWAFDNYSIRTFRDNYIINSDCRCSVFNFRSSVIFEDYLKEKNKFYIGIIEQMNPKWVNRIINRCKTCDTVFIIMKHPLTNVIYDKYPNVIETTKKYKNLDVLITDSSTLILDFSREKIDSAMYYTNKNMHEAFSEYSDIKFLEID